MHILTKLSFSFCFLSWKYYLIRKIFSSFSFQDDYIFEEDVQSKVQGCSEGCPANRSKRLSTGYSFLDRLRIFLHKFT